MYQVITRITEKDQFQEEKTRTFRNQNKALTYFESEVDRVEEEYKILTSTYKDRKWYYYLDQEEDDYYAESPDTNTAIAIFILEKDLDYPEDF